MISNEIYKELKAKKANRSFSELLVDLLHTKENRKGSDLRSFLGVLKKDNEFAAIDSTLRRGWKEWSKKYA